MSKNTLINFKMLSKKAQDKLKKSARIMVHPLFEYNRIIATSGADGSRNWRKGLAELLSKWHPAFQGAVKARKDHRLPEDNVQAIESQVVDASYL
jgi:hypothetical protein